MRSIVWTRGTRWPGVRVGERRRRGRVHLPVPARSDLPARVPRARTLLAPGSLAVASLARPADRATAG